jgi:hypothetical protein
MGTDGAAAPSPEGELFRRAARRSTKRPRRRQTQSSRNDLLSQGTERVAG